MSKKVSRISGGLVAERAQHDRRGELPATVDAGEQAVLRVELEVEPGAAVGNDPCTEQELPRGMGLAAIVIEEHARAPVQLADDDPLGAVDDEGAVARHEGQFPHEHFLLLDVLDDLAAGGRGLVVDDQAGEHAQGSGEGEAADLALALVEGGLAEAVADVVQLDVPRVADDRHDAVEGAVQADLDALLRCLLLLEEGAVGVELRLQQERNLQDRRALAEILADPLLFSERESHRRSSRSLWRAPGERLPCTVCERSLLPGSHEPVPKPAAASRHGDRRAIASETAVRKRRQGRRSSDRQPLDAAESEDAATV